MLATARRGFCSARTPTVQALVRDCVLNACVSQFPAAASVFDSIGITPAASSASASDRDYQTNAAFRIASALHLKPLDVASVLASAVAQRNERAVLGSVLPSGQGFLNICLASDFLGRALVAVATSGVPRQLGHAGKSVLVDFASPNVGKALHVGHLRSAVIGDTLSRLFEYSGAIVDRVSHVGDLGLPVALVMAAMEHADSLCSTSQAGQLSSIVSGAYAAGCLPSPTQLSELYLFAKRLEAQHANKAASEFAQVFNVRVRDLLRDIQLGGSAQASTRALWDRLLASSRRGYGELYARLRVQVQERGESTYVNGLATTVVELLERGIAHHSEGAVVVPIPLAGAPPIVIQKSDGGYLYATIDIVAIRQRLAAGHNHIIYVTDSSQALHFSSLFALAHSQGWTCTTAGSSVQLSHAHFGLVLGADGKKLSSRAGVDMTLDDLLNASVKAAEQVFLDKSLFIGELSSAAQAAAVDSVAHSAVRYFDLSHMRTKNYVFSFEKALTLKGNSAVFLAYAVARLSRLREAVCLHLNEPADASWSELVAKLGSVQPACHATQERQLAISVIQLPDVINTTIEHLMPHMLCDHAHTIAQRFHSFYASCRVVGDASMAERVIMCAATDAALRTAMHLLGVDVVEKL